MRRQAGGKPSQFKFVLVDNGIQAGVDFCTELLKIGDFVKSTLDKFGPRRLSKEMLASAVANSIIDGSVDPNEVVIEFCRQTRMWLSFRLGNTGFAATGLRTASQFLTEFGPDGWYGPFIDEEQSSHWYVHAKGTNHYLFVAKDEPPEKVRLRSHVVAQVRAGYAALHWNNYHYSEADDALRTIQCEYWRDVPQAFDSLEEVLGASLRLPHLSNIVMKKMRATYGHSEEYKWTHKHIRAEASGVAINARSGVVHEHNISGLEVLTGALAHAALRALGLPSDHESAPVMDNAILETLIEQWGTKSYEFTINSKQTFADKKNLFRAHCYFGAKPDDKGPDAFPHMLCNTTQYGGSRAAMDFLLEFL